MDTGTHSTGVTHDGFVPVEECWICGRHEFHTAATAIFELSAYAGQDPDLARYSGATVRLMRCTSCGFAQPEAVPALPDYFGRMYDQRWAPEWLEQEFHAGSKDLIFRDVLASLSRRLPPHRRRLLDLGAHVGRLMSLAAIDNWHAEGVELNPITSAYAAATTGLAVHRADLRTLRQQGRRFDAVTLIDVLEHVPDPVPALRAVRDVLEPGGCIAVQVPHGPNQLRKERIRARLRPGYRPTVADNLVHVCHFTPRSLRTALQSAGFTRVHIRPALPVIPDSRVRIAMLRTVAAIARALPGGAHTPLAMNLQAVASV